MTAIDAGIEITVFSKGYMSLVAAYDDVREHHISGSGNHRQRDQPRRIEAFLLSRPPGHNRDRTSVEQLGRRETSPHAGRFKRAARGPAFSTP